MTNLRYTYNRGQSKGTLAGTTGQLTHIKDKKDRNKDRLYEFDTLGRLITAKGGLAAGAAAPATANWTQGYTYDRYGNKLTTTNAGYTAGNQTIPLDGLALQSFAPTTNRITTAGYSYDKAGNVTRGKSPTGSWQNYEYDTAGRLVYVKDDTNWIQQANEYASSRERLASWSYASVDITYYAWGGSSVLAEYTTQYSSSSLTWQKSYVYAGSRLLSTITNTAGNEVTEYHHPDRLGTRLISNPVTATQSEQLTLPFGTLIGAETSATNDKRFTSYDRSEIAGGLDYAVNRNYNSGQSRFTQVDPIGMASASIGNPQSLNMYAYVQNNPIDFVDPSGLLLAILRCQVVGEARNGQAIYNCTMTFINIGNGPSSGRRSGGGDDIPRGRGGGSRAEEPSKQEDEICDNLDKLEKMVFEGINKVREANGRDPLVWNDNIAKAANTFAEDLASEAERVETQNPNMSYGLPHNDWYQLQDRLRDVGIKGSIRSQSENIGTTGKSKKESKLNSEGTALIVKSSSWSSLKELADAMVTGWVDSPGHFRNLKDKKWKQTGVGVACRKDKPILYRTQLFTSKKP